MCSVGERVLFTCNFKSSTASLCLGADGKFTIYRKSSARKLELSIKENHLQKVPVFWLSNTQYAGGFESHIRFFNRNVIYFLYDKSIKMDDGPRDSAGIIVLKGDKIIADFVCESNASISSAAYDVIRTEDFTDIKSR
jgi:hypothetical protein